MSMTRREFLHTLAVAAAAGFPLGDHARATTAINGFYDLHSFGNNVTLMHFTDCHAQLLPIHFREPSVNLGVGSMHGQMPHLVGEHLLRAAGIPAGTALAHAYTSIDFERAARRFGKVGGFAHLATLVRRLKAARPSALLLDGGDTWQGSGNSSTFSRTEQSSSGTGYTFIYNSWGNWAPKFADDKLLFAFNALLGTAHINGDFNAVTTIPDTTWYGAGAYAKYQINDWFSLMSRGEYLGGNNTLKMYYANPSTTTGNSLWEYTLTAGFNVIDNLLIRAEYRLDWGTGSVNNFQTGRTSGSEVTVPGPAHYAGAEIVYSF